MRSWKITKVQKGPEGALKNELMKDVVLHTLVITFTDVQIMTQVDARFITQANLNQAFHLYSDLRKTCVFA